MKVRIAVLSVVLAAVSVGAVGKAPAAETNEVTLYKNPQCSCCEGYADYLRRNGFKVSVQATHQLSMMGRREGISEDFQGCHLSYVDGYVVSGHVPVKAIRKLLADRPAIKGITLPGMPQGSPGMSGDKEGPWKIYSIGNGSPELYATE